MEYFEDSIHDDIVTPIKVLVLAELLHASKFPKKKSRVLLDGFTKGFDIGYRGPENRTDLSRNIPFYEVGSELELWEKIMKEVKVRRYSGPFDSIPFKSYMQSPLGLVPKARGQTRLIFHLSFDFGPEPEQRSLNFHTPEELCSVKYKDLDYAVQCCLKLLEECNQLRPLYHAKSDLRSAFRILPILPSQRKFLIMKARCPISGKVKFFVEKCLPFGASISRARFQLFSDALKHILEFITQKTFRVTNYLDDYLFLAVNEQECNQLVSEFICLCERIGCPVALDKTEPANIRLQFLGIMLDGASYRLGIPDDKKKKALDLLRWVVDQRSLTVKVIQRLTGTLNFLCRAIVPGRAFTRVLYTRLKTTTSTGKVLKLFHQHKHQQTVQGGL